MNEGSTNQSVIGEGKFLRLVKRGNWEFVERVNATGIVGIVAVNDEGSLILVEQHRPAVGASVIEIPAGLVGDEDDDRVEDLADGARRELLEETGYIARRMLQLTQGPPSAGLSSEVITFFMASGLKKRDSGGGVSDEDITVHEVPLADVEVWLAQREGEGLLIDPKVYLALYFVKRDGGFAPPSSGKPSNESADNSKGQGESDGGDAAGGAAPQAVAAKPKKPGNDSEFTSLEAASELQAAADKARPRKGQTIVTETDQADAASPSQPGGERGEPEDSPATDGSGESGPDAALAEADDDAALLPDETGQSSTPTSTRSAAVPVDAQPSDGPDADLAFVDDSPSSTPAAVEPEPPPPDPPDDDVGDAVAFTDESPASGPPSAEAAVDDVAFADDEPASGPPSHEQAVEDVAFTDDAPAAGPTSAPDDGDDDEPQVVDVDDVAFSDDSPASGPAKPADPDAGTRIAGGHDVFDQVVDIVDEPEAPSTGDSFGIEVEDEDEDQAEDSDDVIDMADAGAATGLGDMLWMRPDAEDEESILVAYSTSTEDTSDGSIDDLGIPEASTDFAPTAADLAIPEARVKEASADLPPTSPAKPAEPAKADKPATPDKAPAKRPVRWGRFAGLLLGTAVGDAIGLPYEGLSPRRIVAMYGRPPIKHRLLFGQGLVSDDTEHACMTAQAWLASGGDPVRFEKALAWRMRWWIASLPAGTGLATAKACIKLWAFIPPKKAGVQSAGNGPCMRAPVLALLARDDYDLERMVMLSTRMTHSDPKAFEAAFALAQVARYIAGRSAARIDPLLALDGVRRWARDVELERNLQAALLHIKRGSTPQAFIRSLGMDSGVSGYVCHTVPVVLYVWARHHLNYRKAVEEAIMLGGDTDTTAALVGALVGAAAGEDAIPEEWLDGMADYPRTIEWMRDLAYRLAEATGTVDRTPGQFPPLPMPAWPVIPARNMAFASVAITHGLRRLLPPYAT